MIDIGQRIREELQRQERSAGWLARKLGIHRSIIYRTLDKTSIDTDLLLRIGHVLGHDFFRDYSEAEAAGSALEAK